MEEELEKEIQRYNGEQDGDCRYVQTARHFARWTRDQMMKEAVEGEIDKASDAFADSKIDKLDSPGFFTTKHYFEAGVHWLYRKIFGKTLSLPGDNLIVKED